MVPLKPSSALVTIGCIKRLKIILEKENDDNVPCNLSKVGINLKLCTVCPITIIKSKISILSSPRISSSGSGNSFNVNCIGYTTRSSLSYCYYVDAPSIDFLGTHWATSNCNLNIDIHY